MPDDNSIEKMILILQKHPNERSAKEIMTLCKGLEHSDLIKKFRINNRDTADLHQMIYNCSLNMRYKMYEKGKTVFQYGEKGDNFYIILKGRVQVLKPVAVLERLTAIDYLHYIKTLHDKKDKPLIKIALEANKNTFQINSKDIPELDKILFKLKYRRALIQRASIQDLKNIFKEFNIEPELFSIKESDFDKIYDFKEKDINIFYQTELSYFTSELNSGKYENYNYALDDVSKKILTIFYMNEFITLEIGNYFGDSALDDGRDRTASIITLEDTHLGCLESNIYKEHISVHKRRFVLKEIMFLSGNFFFSSIKKETFESNFYLCFIYEEFFRGDIIIKENQPIKYIYFIKEGEIEISCNKNILEIHKIIKLLTSLKINFPSTVKEPYKLQNQPKNFLEDLKRNKKYKLFIYGLNEIIAAEQFFYNLNSFFQAKAISDKVKLYKIEVKDLQNIIEDKNCLADFEKFCKDKIIMFTNRFNDIKDISLKFLDNKILGRRDWANSINVYEKTGDSQMDIERVDTNLVNNQNIKNIFNRKFSKEEMPYGVQSQNSLKSNDQSTNTKNMYSPNKELNILPRYTNPNLLELPTIESTKKNSENCLENQQIKILKKEIRMFDKFRISNKSKSSIKNLNSLKEIPLNRKVSLDTAADYYVKTFNKNTLNSIENLLTKNCVTDFSTYNETIINNRNSLRRTDRMLKSKMKFLKKKKEIYEFTNLNRFKSENSILLLNSNIPIENSDKKELSVTRFKTEENSNIKKKKSSLVAEDNMFIRSMLLSLNFNGTHNNVNKSKGSIFLKNDL